MTAAGARTGKARALHVTNGDCAVEALRAAGVHGDFLPWRDVLHEGPVPEGLTSGQLAAVRAAFVADRGWTGFAHAHEDFRRRDLRLARCADYDETVLWFEHDLYDQLQLIQVLDRVAAAPRAPRRLTMTVETGFISMMAPELLHGLFAGRRPVSRTAFEAAARAWSAFRAPDPASLAGLRQADLAALPFLHAALSRLLEEFPAPGSGLSRTERQILEAVAAGADSPARAFRTSQAREEATFMGDASFWEVLRRLLAGVRPLLAWTEEPPAFPPATPHDRSALDRKLRVTPAGLQALAGELDHATLNGFVRWIGGVRLAPGNLWRFDPVHRRIEAP